MKTPRIPWLAWAPTRETGVAALSALAMIGLYWTTTQVPVSGWSAILVVQLTILAWIWRRQMRWGEFTTKVATG